MLLVHVDVLGNVEQEVYFYYLALGFRALRFGQHVFDLLRYLVEGDVFSQLRHYYRVVFNQKLLCLVLDLE